MSSISLMIATILIVIDQLSKSAVIDGLKNQAPLVIWQNVFELRYCENTGVAFSMLENQRWIFIPLTVAVSALLIVMLFRSPMCKNVWFRTSCTLILAGGVGNLIDRIAYGYVVDFLYFKLINFPIFNFADCCVTVGAVLLFVFFLFLYKPAEGSKLKTELFGIPSVNKEQNNGNR